MAPFRIALCVSILAHAVPTFAAKTVPGCSASSVTPMVLTLTNNTLPFQDAYTYGIKVDVGSPKQQVVLTPSTVVDNTLLVSKEICADEVHNMSRAQCRSYHGGVFDIAAAGASFHDVSATTLSTDLAWNLFNDPYHVAGETDLGLVSNVVTSNMTVAVINTGTNFTAGHFGLGNHSVLLNYLKDAQLIPSRGFGLNAGSQSMENPRDGNVVLGGYDSASTRSTFYTYEMNYPELLADRPCPLQVQIQSLQLLLTGRDPISLLEPADKHGACIEPYDSLFRLSGNGLQNFKAVTGWTNSTFYDPDQLYVPEPGLMYDSNIGFNGSLKFILDNGYSVEIPNHELQHPLRALDKNGGLVLQPNVTQVNVYAAPHGAWVLGKVFLSQVYLAVDYEAERFQLADVKQNEVTASPVRFPLAATACTKGNRLSGGSIAAIVLGAVIGIVLIVGIGCWLRKRRNKKHGSESGARHRGELLHDPRLSVAETSTVNGHTGIVNEYPSELPGVRRRSEMSCPNGGYAPPSPRTPPPLQISTSPHNALSPYETVSPEIPRSERLTEPWNV